VAIKKWKQFESSTWFRRNKQRLKRWVEIEPKLSPDLDIDLVTIGDWSLVDRVLNSGGMFCTPTRFTIEIEFGSRFDA